MWTDFLEHHCQLTITHVIHNVISYDVSHHIAYHQNSNDYVSKVITKKKIVLGLRDFFSEPYANQGNDEFWYSQKLLSFYLPLLGLLDMND